jgi:surface protein
MFHNCGTLTTVPLFNTAAVTTMNGMFQNCSALISVPLFNTVAVTSMASMFSACRSLTTVPQFNTAAVTDMSNMFQHCFALATAPLFNTAVVTSANNMFQHCNSLRFIPALNFNALTADPLFSHIPYLSKILATFRRAVSLANCSLSAAALNEFFTAQPSPTTAGTAITITNNPGAATCDRSIATAKGWVVTG